MSIPKQIPIGGWKVKTSFLVALGGVILQILGQSDIANALFAAAGALGVLGVGHKAEKIKAALEETKK